ncbi:MAG: prolipoprotein diacylglyceryl transferase [Deltaproteobacteria bacterium]|nr:prolipoprotein diacylglyceryl transferase [Deltaproteobacteria bacterium]
MYPIMFTIPGLNLPIYSYGVMLGVSLIIGWYVVLGLGKRDGLSREWMSSCYVWTAVFAIIGARLLYILTNLDEFQDPKRMLEFRQGGLVAYGGFLGGFFGSWWYARRNRSNPRVDFVTWADAVVPSLATGLLFTRIGCLLYGCDFGGRITSESPGWVRSLAMKFPNWATRFPEMAQRFRGGSGCSGPLNGSPAYGWHVKHYGLDQAAHWSYAVHPTQIYEAAVGLFLFGVLMLVRWKLRRFTGQLFLVFVIMYGIIRTLLEFIRDDPERGGIQSASTSQIIGLGTAILAIVGYYYMLRRAKAHPDKALWRPAEAAATAPVTKGRKPRSKKRR